MSTLNPKDKAAELVDTFRGTILSFLSDNMKDNNAKQCAIVSVKEVLNLVCAMDGKEHWQEYYEQVLIEIEKL